MMTLDDERFRPKYTWEDLRRLWTQISAGTAPWIPGRALEFVVLKSFELDGAQVRWPYQVRMAGQQVEQIDGAVYAAGLSCLVECKDIADPVNVEPIAKLRNQLLRRPAGVVGMLFARSGYTDPAVTLAQFTAPHPILLWFPEEIGEMLDSESAVGILRKKYNRCVEEAIPHYNVTMEGIG